MELQQLNQKPFQGLPDKGVPVDIESLPTGRNIHSVCLVPVSLQDASENFGIAAKNAFGYLEDHLQDDPNDPNDPSAHDPMANTADHPSLETHRDSLIQELRYMRYWYAAIMDAEPDEDTSFRPSADL
ncbi:hypothetical protein F66182_479 [Fusarium sp. NRRL 66182]|nr:hypothetical protein F66182_479 [Fusarium sp. NRRL 66182]